ncbi:MAG: hypothetical protein M0031_10200 [Thermaerobacter sp.]|jgi:hypothetical protein|nr:hypothetical protein [Thermaerobacter sp.]
MLDATVAAIKKSLEESGGVPRSILARAMGSCLHDFYAGVEDVLELIAVNFDEMTEKTERWHRDLLDRMGGESWRSRPPVLSASLRDALEDYLDFRNLYRNRPGHKLDPALMAPLLERIPAVYGQFRDEVREFIKFLNAAAFEQEMAGFKENEGGNARRAPTDRPAKPRG